MFNKKNTKNEKLKCVPFTSVKLTDEFWAPRLQKHQETTIKSCIKQCENTGRISNFAKAAGLEEGEFEGILFNDSDVYKVIEGIAYSLINNPNAHFEKITDQIIDKISAAQEIDGYLDTYFTLAKPEDRWTDMMAHETYCGGHLAEAAIAYSNSTGKNKLLDTAIKMIDHYIDVFGGQEKHWITGHQEIELALIKLYREIGDEKYLKLSKWFIEQRGHGYNFTGISWDRGLMGGPEYNQDDKPIRELIDIRGHAVRAMYYFCAVTDLADLTGDEGYIKAMDRLWESTVLKNMYITGGIGPSKSNEGFTHDYDLPDNTAYCETCASVGVVLWNHRMNLLHGDSKYADIMERALYNGVISGVSLEGDKYFYVNPLSSDGTHHREQWYDVSCCPTQIARFIPSIGNYIYTVSDKGILVNLYIASKSTIDLQGSEVNLIQTSRYPWEGLVNIKVDPGTLNEFEMKMRFPGWCRSMQLFVNDLIIENPVFEKGYIKLLREWRKGDIVTLKFDMPVEKINSHPRVISNKGKTAIQRGPVVYCFEETDNKDDFENIYIPYNAKFFTEYKEQVLGGVTVINVMHPEGNLILKAIPYYAWDNREPGRMSVWIKEESNHNTLYF